MIDCKIAPPLLSNYQRICKDYLKIIGNKSKLINSFIQHFYNNSALTIDFKLFIADVFFSELDLITLPIDKFIELIEQKNWLKNHFFDHSNHHGFSEKNELIYSKLANNTTQASILKNYHKHINLLGYYENTQCYYHCFSVYPKEIKIYHNIFLNSFLIPQPIHLDPDLESDIKTEESICKMDKLKN